MHSVSDSDRNSSKDLLAKLRNLVPDTDTECPLTKGMAAAALGAARKFNDNYETMMNDYPIIVRIIHERVIPESFFNEGEFFKAYLDFMKNSSDPTNKHRVAEAVVQLFPFDQSKLASIVYEDIINKLP